MGIVKNSEISQNSKFAMSLKKKEVRVEVNFFHADKHQGFLQGDLLLLMGMIKHSQAFSFSKYSKYNKFAVSLQCLNKEVIRDGIHFLYADKHQSFYKLTLSFLMKVARHNQSTQNTKLVILRTS